MMTAKADGGKDVADGRDAPFVPFAFAGGSCNVAQLRAVDGTGGRG
jgi:hypothetical protein